MNDILGSVFAVVWFLIIFKFLKGYGDKAKKAGNKTEKGRMRVERPAPRTGKPAVTGSDEVTPQSGSYKSDFDSIQEKTVRKPKTLKAGEARPARTFLKESSALSELMVEDRRNDWLARQIREEKKHVVWNNFVDLGAAHDEACAAELNRRDHHSKHQSYVVDDGITDN